MPTSLTIELDTHEVYMLRRAGHLSNSERVHLLARLREKLPGQLTSDSGPSSGIRDRKLDLDTALDELWQAVGSLDGENWTPVTTPDHEYPDHRVSDYGRVVSLPVERLIALHGRKIKRVYPGRLLSTSTTTNGRERVCLRKDGRQKQHYVDHLVWWGFQDHRDVDVVHLNGDPKDSRLENLRADE